MLPEGNSWNRPQRAASEPSALLFNREVRFDRPAPHMDFDSPIVGVLLALAVGAGLIAISYFARGLGDPLRGFVRLSLGDVSFTEVFGVFLLGYGIGALIAGPTPDTPGGGPRPGGGFGRGFGGPASALLRGGPAVTTGFAIAFIWTLYRVDVLGKLTNPQSHKSVAAIVGTVAEAVEEIPAGGHGQITFRDPGGTLVGVIAASDVHVPRGARVRIVGTKGLNPLVVLDAT